MPRFEEVDLGVFAERRRTGPPLRSPKRLVDYLHLMQRRRITSSNAVSAGGDESDL
jgi:hypothetical protein